MKEIKHIPLILFSICVSKMIYAGASFSDAAVILVVGAVAAFYEFKSQEKKLQDMKAIQDKQAEATLALAKALDEMKSTVGTIKLAQGMRSSSVGRQ